MESNNVNIRPTLAMYWEGDRSSVKARYDAIFPSATEPLADAAAGSSERPAAEQENDILASPTPTDWETLWDQQFRKQVADFAFTESIATRLFSCWDKLQQDARPIALHHLMASAERNWSLRYVFEGLAACFDLEVASLVLHFFSPTDVFPIDREVSYVRLKSILRILGIDYDDSSGLTPLEVAENISEGVRNFNEFGDWQPWQTWAMVYDLGPRLLPDPPPYPADILPKVWIVSANKDGGDFEYSDKHASTDIIDWCINARAKRGDIAMMYHLAPRSAFVSVYRCYSDAFDDRLRGEDTWTGESVLMTDKIEVPWLTLKEMKKDEILSGWGMIKRNFVGLLQSEVPPDIWYRIRDLIAAKDAEIGQFLDNYAASAGGVHSIAAIGEDISEKEVEDTLVIPLLQALGWSTHRNLERQHEMDIKVGSGKPKRVRADFVGFKDALGSEVLMVVETKYRIHTDRELEEAVGQCESYAGKLRCPRFAVAAPEGLWIYRMNFPGYSDLLLQVPLQRDVPPLTLQKIRPFLEFTVLKEGVR